MITQVSFSNVGLERNGRWLFRDMNLSLSKGQLIALVGPSGAGKSSLLESLAGLCDLSHGEINFKDDAGNTLTRDQLRPQTGFIFQKLRLATTNNSLKNVLCGRLGRYPWWKTLWGFSKNDQQAAKRLLDKLGLQKIHHRRVGQISGGEQQRVAIARSLLQEPDIYLADEPVSNLDHSSSHLVLNLLKEECKQRGCLVICALHDLNLVDQFADAVLHLNASTPSGWFYQQVESTRAA